MQTPPIPPPTPYSCPNCGLPLDELVPLCPRCGARIQKPVGNPWWRILLGVVLVLLALPLGASGACFMLFAPSASPGNEFFPSTPFIFGAWGAGLLALTALCIWGARKMFKK